MKWMKANEDAQLCFPPVAEKVVECFTRSVDRAMSIPRRCVVPDNSHEGWNRDSPMYEPGMGARVAYLANVSAETINEFVSKTLTPRVKGTDSYHAMIASASGRSARGAVHVGNCVAVARRIASALRERGEVDAGLLALGTDLFRDQAVCLDAFVDEWTGKIADTCVDAFNRSAAMYFGGVHLLERFGKDRDKLTPGGDGELGAAKKQDSRRDSRGDGADADASPLLLNPLGVLRDGLNVIPRRAHRRGRDERRRVVVRTGRDATSRERCFKTLNRRSRVLRLLHRARRGSFPARRGRDRGRVRGTPATRGELPRSGA
jgi:hypothetical protein